MQTNRTLPLVLAAVAALSLPVLGQGQAKRRFVTTRKTPKIALLPVINQSKIGGDAVADTATEALTRLLQDRAELLVIPPADVQKVAGQDLRDPQLKPEEQVAIGRLLNVDWVLRFVITQAGIYQAKRPYGALELNGYALSTDHGKLVGRVYARGARWENGQANAKFNPNLLLEQAAADAVDQIVELTSIESVVTNRVDGGLLRVALGTQNYYFRMNGEVAFVDGDEIVGYGDTVEVDDTQALIRLRTPSSYQRIGINTRVRPVYNPPLYAKGRTVRQIEARIEKKEDIIFAVATAATLVTGYLQSRLHSSLAGGGTGTPFPGVPPIPGAPAIPPGALPPPPPP